MMIEMIVVAAVEKFGQNQTCQAELLLGKERVDEILSSQSLFYFDSLVRNSSRHFAAKHERYRVNFKFYLGLPPS